MSADPFIRRYRWMMVVTIVVALGGIGLTTPVRASNEPDDASAVPSRRADAEGADAIPRADTIPRGDLSAEIGGAFVGYFLGGALTGLVTLGAAHAAGDADSFDDSTVYGLGSLPGALVGTGLGAGLAGDNTGGNGKLGFAALGSTLGGLGGAAAASPLVWWAATSDLGGPDYLHPAEGIALGSSALLVLGGMFGGGVLGYRLSAEPEEHDPAFEMSFTLSPPARRSHPMVGVSVVF